MRAPWLFGFSPVMCTFQRVKSLKKKKKKSSCEGQNSILYSAVLLCGGVSCRIDGLIAKVNVRISQAHKGNCLKKYLSVQHFHLMAVLHQIKPGHLELSFEWKLIANTSYKCVCFLLSCVRVIVQCLRHSTWRALEANDTLWPHLVAPSAAHEHVQGWLASDQTAVPLRTRSSCGWRVRCQGLGARPWTGPEPFTRLFLLFAPGEPCAGLRLLTRTHKEGKGERSTEDHTSDFAEGPGKCKPFRDGKKNNKKTQRKQAIKKLELVLFPSCHQWWFTNPHHRHMWFSFFNFHRWSPQTHENRRGLCLQRQRGSPPLEPETLWSSWRGNIVLGGLLVIFCPEQTDVAFIPQYRQGWNGWDSNVAVTGDLHTDENLCLQHRVTSWTVVP